jgi:hypothetical protein
MGVPKKGETRRFEKTFLDSGGHSVVLSFVTMIAWDTRRIGPLKDTPRIDMSRKTMIMIGMVVGSFVGGYLPTLLGADSISIGSVLGSGAGGILGIWIAVTFTR